MRNTTVVVCCFLAALFATPSSIQAQPESFQSTTELRQSCRAFVQRFYSWYAPHWLKPSGSLGYEQALRQPQLFGSELLRGLNEDHAAWAQNRSGYIVSLDFDPFLAANGKFQSFIVGNVTLNKNRCRVAVRLTWPGRKSGPPDVIPELAFTQRRWQFVNFHYTSGAPPDDLLSILKGLREARQKRSSRYH